MAHQKPDEEDSSSSPVEEAIPCGGGHGSTSSSAEEKSRPTNCLLAARSLRSTTTIPAAQAQSHRSLSFSKLLSFRLPSTMGYIDRLDDEESVLARGTIDKEEKLKRICRSQSVPTSLNSAKAGSTRRVGPAAGFRVLVVSNDLEGEGAAGEEAEDIAAEEAVCRICMVELSEGGALLKLECSCKGELALAHSGCAIKWFSIKGNGACDVCGQEVLNLPITLQICHQLSATQQQQQNAPTSTTSRRYSRVLQGRTILVIISMLGYFCFLEQLLVGDHGTAALAISLPFACVLGLFSSLTTIKMVSRRYVWIYSAAQFLFIVLFTNLFYRYVRMQAVIAIILSTFAGFSVAICANSILLQILRWRARRVASPAITEEEPHGHSTDLESAQPPS